MAAGAHQLFECFLHVGLSQGEDGRLTPVVKSQFPKSASQASHQSIVQFCFPDVDLIRAEAKMKSATFSFVLTETSGERRFGYCRRLLPKGSGKRLPECFCLTSFFPCFAVFNSILDEVESRSTFPSFSAVTFFLEAVFSKQLPEPGQTLTVHVCSWDHPGQVDQHSFQRPSDNDSLLDHVSLEPLLAALEPRHLLLLYGALLVERRVIFVSNSLPVLSACVQAAVALLYPFTWQHIYIPVLPASLLSFCCAPMPFVVGVLESALDALSELPLDETLIVDLDENRFLRYPNPDHVDEDYDTLDDVALAQLHRALHDSRQLLLGKKAGKSKALAPAAKERLTVAFLKFIVAQIAHFQEYVRAAADDDDGGAEIDKAAFVASRPAGAVPLARALVGSQMFEQFVAETGRNGLPSNSPVQRWHAWYLQAELAQRCEEQNARSAVAAVTASTPADRVLKEGWMRHHNKHSKVGDAVSRYVVLAAGGLYLYAKSDNVAKHVVKAAVPLPPGTHVALSTKIDPARVVIEITAATGDAVYLEPVDDASASPAPLDPRQHLTGLETVTSWCALLRHYVDMQPTPRPRPADPVAASTSSPTVSADFAAKQRLAGAVPMLGRGGPPLFVADRKPQSKLSAKSKRPSSTKLDSLIRQPPKAGIVTPHDLAEAKAMFSKESSSLAAAAATAAAAKPRSAAKEALGQYDARPPRPQLPASSIVARSSSLSSSPPSPSVEKPARSPLLTGSSRSMQSLPLAGATPSSPLSYRTSPSPPAAPLRSSPSPPSATPAVTPSTPPPKPRMVALRPGGDKTGSLPRDFALRPRDAAAKPADRFKHATIDATALMNQADARSSPPRALPTTPPRAAPVDAAVARTSPAKPPRPSSLGIAVGHTVAQRPLPNPPAKPRSAQFN